MEDVRFINNKEKVELGQGGYGKVSLIYHKNNWSKLYAMKEISKSENLKWIY